MDKDERRLKDLLDWFDNCEQEIAGDEAEELIRRLREKLEDATKALVGLRDVLAAARSYLAAVQEAGDAAVTFDCRVSNADDRLRQAVEAFDNDPP